MKTITQGKIAEDQACLFLQKKGLKLVEKNYRCRTGEIDLVMQDKKELVFVEVRYRANNDYGSALDSVDQQKIQKDERASALNSREICNLFCIYKRRKWKREKQIC